MFLSVSVIDESVKLLGSAFWQVIVALAVTLPQAPYFYTGETFCQLTQWVAVTGRVHYIMGGFGIALMRALFVRYPNSLCFGQNATAAVISATTLGSTAFFTYIYVTAPKRAQDLVDLCKGDSEDFREVIFHYSSDKSILYEGRVATYLEMALGILLVLSELAFYILIYQFLMNHDRSMSVLLSENVIKSRMRKNVITLAGHTMSFVVQALWVLVWLLRILRKKGNLGTTVTEVVLLRCWSSSMDGVLSVLHIAFSTPLRTDCIAIWNFISSPLQRIQGWVNSIVPSRNTRRVNIAPPEVRSRQS